MPQHMKRQSKDIRYYVCWTRPDGRQEKEFASYENAKSLAWDRAVATGSATFDVVIYTEAGARLYGGEVAVKRYNELKDTLFERLVITIARQDPS